MFVIKGPVTGWHSKITTTDESGNVRHSRTSHWVAQQKHNNRREWKCPSFKDQSLGGTAKTQQPTRVEMSVIQGPVTGWHSKNTTTGESGNVRYQRSSDWRCSGASQASVVVRRAVEAVRRAVEAVVGACDSRPGWPTSRSATVTS